jgi:hypothetical protein
MWGRTKEWPTESVKQAVSGRIALVNKTEIGGTGVSFSLPHVPVILLIDQEGRTLLSISPSLWDDKDLMRLWERLSIEPVEGWPEPMPPEAIRRRYAGAVAELPRSTLPLFRWRC